MFFNILNIITTLIIDADVILIAVETAIPLTLNL